MNYSDIKYNDIANGPGVRVSFFVSGCTHHCKGCFNEETWDFNNGKPLTREKEQELLKEINKKKKLSLLGGDPLDNLEGIFNLILKVKQHCPQTNIWLWTGYTIEEILKDKDKAAILLYIDVLVDGRFVESKKDLRLKYKGSSNQRVLDAKECLLHKKAVIIEEYNN